MLPSSNATRDNILVTRAPLRLLPPLQLPMETTWQNLRDLCREYGEIRFAEIRRKGTGAVKFHVEADARRAVGILCCGLSCDTLCWRGVVLARGLINDSID